MEETSTYKPLFLKGFIMSWLAGILLFVVDRGSKWLTLAFLKGEEPLWVIPEIFRLNYIINPGVAFGLFENWAHLQPYFALGVVALFVLLLWRYQFSTFEQICFSLIIAGALGNAVDRFLYGHVIDMLEFTFIPFPVFNMADVGVVFGAAGLMLALVFSKKTLLKKERNHIDEG